MNEQELIKRAMSILGSRTSPRKRKASAKNADLGWRARWKDHVKKPKKPQENKAKNPAQK
jgi:hypothetical protein